MTITAVVELGAATAPAPVTLVGPVTLLGAVTALAVVGVWLVQRRWTQYVVAATAVFPQTAALIIGDNGFPLFYLAVVLIAVLSIPPILYGIARPQYWVTRSSRRVGWVEVVSIVLVVWAGLLAFVAPRLFAGVQVYGPELGIGAAQTIPLAPSLGNLAQFGYLAIAVTFLLLCGRLFPVDARLVSVTLWLVIVLALVRQLGQPLLPKNALVVFAQNLQNMPGFNYATAERLSGTLHEPSVLGMYLAAAAAFFGARLGTPGRARVLASIALAVTAVDFVFNRSGTALLGGAIVAGIALVVAAWRLAASSRVRIHPARLVAAILLVGVALAQLPLVYQLTLGYAAEKTETSSFSERGAANLRSWYILAETWGVGVGLGSHRPSSLFFLVLSCLGIVGILLLATLIVLALRRASRIPAARPLRWALLGAVAAAVVAVPDLSAPLLWLTIAACLAHPSAPPDARSAPEPVGAAVGVA